MKDRIPTYPGRVEVTHEDGTKELVTVKRADEPTQEGTALNKGNLLDDSAAYRCGLDGIAATPSNAFSRCAPIAFHDAYTDFAGGVSDKIITANAEFMNDAAGAATDAHCVFCGGTNWNGSSASRINRLISINGDFINLVFQSSRGIYILSAATAIHDKILVATNIQDNTSTSFVICINDDNIETVVRTRGYIGNKPIAASTPNRAFFLYNQLLSSQNYSSTVAYDENLIATNLATYSNWRSWIVPFRKKIVYTNGYNYSGIQNASISSYDDDLILTSLPNLDWDSSTSSPHSTRAGSNSQWLLVNVGSTSSNFYTNFYDKDFVHRSEKSPNKYYYIGYDLAYSGAAHIFCGSSNVGGISTVDTDLMSVNAHATIEKVHKQTSLNRNNISDTVFFKDYLLVGGFNIGNRIFPRVFFINTGPSLFITIPNLSSYQFEGIHSGEQQAIKETTYNHDGKATGYIRRGMLLENQITPF